MSSNKIKPQVQSTATTGGCTTDKNGNKISQEMTFAFIKIILDRNKKHHIFL